MTIVNLVILTRFTAEKEVHRNLPKLLRSKIAIFHWFCELTADVFAQKKRSVSPFTHNSSTLPYFESTAMFSEIAETLSNRCKKLATDPGRSYEIRSVR
jgi:hypothetical protein